MSKKNHRIIDGKLLQTDKKYSHLKLKQKEKIYLWMFSIIGGADGPAAIFLAGKVGSILVVTGIIAGVGIVLLAVGIFIHFKTVSGICVSVYAPVLP